MTMGYRHWKPRGVVGRRQCHENSRWWRMKLVVMCRMGECPGEGGELSRNRTESGIESDRFMQKEKNKSLSSRNLCVLSEVLTCLLTYSTDKICLKVF